MGSASKKISKELVTILIVLLGIASIQSIKLFVRSSHAEVSFEQSSSAKTKGNPQAPIYIIEFVDFQCPSCAVGAGYLKQMMQKYPGKIRLEVKHFPLNSHRHALIAAHYAECAALAGKFWTLQDLLFERQEEWAERDDAKPAFERYAQEAGLDLRALESCLENEKVFEIIKSNKADGKLFGIERTPSYLVGGKLFIGKDQLKQEIQRLLHEK